MSDQLFELLGLDPDDPEVEAALEDDADLANLMHSLYEFRLSRGMTQAEVATRMGTTQSAVSDLERTAVDPRISTLQRYARAMDASLKLRVVATSKVWGQATRFRARARVAPRSSGETRKLRAVINADSENLGA